MSSMSSVRSVRTVAEVFAEFKRRLEPTELQESEASARQNYIRQVLHNRIDVISSFLTGSYRRNTRFDHLVT